MFFVYNVLITFGGYKMASIELQAHAKINLSLDVLRKREDGYHDLQMIMQSIGLHDKVYVETSESGITVESGSRWVPSGMDNIAYKAAALILEKAGLKSGVNIRIKKKIPVAAGLAGGSTDAAAVLKAVNRLYNIGLKKGELMELGKQIGADVPYCIAGGTMLAEGIGEKLTSLKPFRNIGLILLKPKIGVSTGWVYGNLNLQTVKAHPDTGLLLEAIKNKDVTMLAQNMKNVLEEVTIPRYEIVQAAKDRLMELGAAGAMMSGSGPSVFGIFTEGGVKAGDVYDKARDKRWESFITRTI
jgi:4-diphosphocytidyl-2-C-methyl-D-erythritol kinase